jgi:hypothetical protein
MDRIDVRIRIPASEIVEGMIVHRLGKYRAIVKLPGPSPRELLCTCLYTAGCGHQVEASRQGWHCAPCGFVRTLDLDDTAESTIIEILNIKHLDPHRHDTNCPVAPNADRSRGPVHGGLRLWPVGGHAPHASSAASNAGFRWIVGSEALRQCSLEAVLDGQETLSTTDRLVMAFCHPPQQPRDRPAPTPWDPEGAGHPGY